MSSTKYIQCRSCNKLNTFPVSVCSRCGTDYESRHSLNGAVIMFPSGTWEHLAAEPVYIRGRKQLAQETAARGLTANYLNPGPTMKELKARGGEVSNRYH